MAATISAVDFWDTRSKEWKVHYKPKSFRVDHITRQVNGFEETSLIDGKPFAEVQKEVSAFIENRLIIFCGAGSDFDLLDLCAADYTYFDIQRHWYSTKINNKGLIIKEPLSLASIYRHYYPTEPFQTGKHDSTEDARATMKIFREQYLKLKIYSKHQKDNEEPFNNIARFVPEWKKAYKARKKNKRMKLTAC